MLTLREKHEYESEIAYLKLRLRRAITSKSKMKERHKKLRESVKTTITRSDRARLLIELKWNGKLEITLKGIAKKVFLSYAAVNELSSEYKKGLKGK